MGLWTREGIGNDVTIVVTFPPCWWSKCLPQCEPPSVTSVCSTVPLGRLCSLLCPCRGLLLSLQSLRGLEVLLDPRHASKPRHHLRGHQGDPRLSDYPEISRISNNECYSLRLLNILYEKSAISMCSPDCPSCSCPPCPCSSPRARPCPRRPASSSPPRWACGCRTAGWAWRSALAQHLRRPQTQWIRSLELAVKETWIIILVLVCIFSRHLRIQVFRLVLCLLSLVPASGWSWPRGLGRTWRRGHWGPPLCSREACCQQTIADCRCNRKGRILIQV